MKIRIKELIKEPPNDKYKYILIKKHLGQFNAVLDKNIESFFKFSELYEWIIITMRSND